MITREQERALSGFLKNLEAQQMPDGNSVLASYIGLGLACEELKEYGSAKQHYQKAIERP
jgi:hypothetical protein